MNPKEATPAAAAPPADWRRLRQRAEDAVAADRAEELGGLLAAAAAAGCRERVRQELVGLAAANGALAALQALLAAGCSPDEGYAEPAPLVRGAHSPAAVAALLAAGADPAAYGGREAAREAGGGSALAMAAACPHAAKGAVRAMLRALAAGGAGRPPRPPPADALVALVERGDPELLREALAALVEHGDPAALREGLVAGIERAVVGVWRAPLAVLLEAAGPALGDPRLAEVLAGQLKLAAGTLSWAARHHAEARVRYEAARASEEESRGVHDLLAGALGAGAGRAGR